MTAMKKEELERLEAEHGLEPGELSYQLRCSRIAAVLKGVDWVPPKPRRKKAAKAPARQDDPDATFRSHPLYGKRILITPLMRPDAKRNIAYEEDLGPEITVRDVDAGERLYGQPEEVDRMVGDYEITHVDRTRRTTAKTTFPKIGTEISWCIGRELVPVVRGNNGKRGYIWSFPTSVMQIGDSLIQVYGLKTLIQQTFPELIPKFSGKPIMDYIDGVTLAADIPMTEALIRQRERQERIDEQAGIGW